MNIRMIVTDLDGTLLQPDKSVSERTVRAVQAAQSAGVLVVPATGRSMHEVPRVLPEELHDLTVCSNGAVVYSVRTDTVLLSRTIAPEVIDAFTDALLAVLPGARFATLVNAGLDFLPGPGYLELMTPGDHGRDMSKLREVALSELASRPVAKLVARHGELNLDELMAACQGLAHMGVTPTTSGVPFIEMSASGVSKATTLEILARERGIEREEIVVFGDSANDLEMISWAGHGIAMANAVDAVLAAADEIAPANTADGVAVVIERLLGL